MTQRTRTPATPTQPQADKPLKGNQAARNLLAQAISNKKLSELPTREERLLAVADAIERTALVNRDIGFNMETYHGLAGEEELIDKTENACGTVACIAGWTMLMENDWSGSHAENDEGYNFHDNAKELLGLSDEEAARLFLANGARRIMLEDITPQHAVSVIRHLAKTGKVDWDAFGADGKPVTKE